MNDKPILIETVVMAAILLVCFLLFGRFDVFEKIVAWSRQYEDYEMDEILTTSMVLVFLMMIFAVRRWRETKLRERVIDLKNRDLQKAMDEIKQLRGILPLCSFCKKVRNDKGYWEQVDVYLQSRTNADISHSICPRCMDEHYPEEPGTANSDSRST